MDVAPSALAVARDIRAVDVETAISSRFPPLLLNVDDAGKEGSCLLMREAKTVSCRTHFLQHITGDYHLGSSWLRSCGAGPFRTEFIIGLLGGC